MGPLAPRPLASRGEAEKREIESAVGQARMVHVSTWTAKRQILNSVVGQFEIRGLATGKGTSRQSQTCSIEAPWADRWELWEEG